MTRSTSPWATPSSPAGRRIILAEPATQDLPVLGSPIFSRLAAGPTAPPSRTGAAVSTPLAAALAAPTVAAVGAAPSSRIRRPEDGRPRSTPVVPPGASSTPWPTPARRTPVPPSAPARSAATGAVVSGRPAVAGAAARSAPVGGSMAAVAPSGHAGRPGVAPVRCARRRRLVGGLVGGALLIAPVLGLVIARAGAETPAPPPAAVAASRATTSSAAEPGPAGDLRTARAAAPARRDAGVDPLAKPVDADVTPEPHRAHERRSTRTHSSGDDLLAVRR